MSGRCEMSGLTDKKSRIQCRINSSVKKTIQLAADILGTSLSEFVINSACVKAQKIIKEKKENK